MCCAVPALRAASYDILFYLTHRLLHLPRFYRFHKLHHTYTAPFSLTSEVAHPVETLGSFVVPFFSGLTACVLIWNDHSTKLHILVVWCYIGIELLYSAEGHSGYAGLPWQIASIPVLKWFNGG